VSTKGYSRSVGVSWTLPAQRTFILLQFVLMAGTTVYLLYVIFGAFEGVRASLVGARPEVVEATFDHLIMVLLLRISVIFVILFALNVLFGLLHLHRIVGPLVRMTAILERIADGKIPPRDVALRKGDFPNELAGALTRVLHRIHEWRRL
jgi:hypothetical protein